MEKTRRLRTWGGFLLLLLLLLIFLIWNILAGSVRLPASEIWTILQGGGELSQRRILLQIRLPRLVAALILGGALSVSGYLLQTFFHNPIAGPFVLGISSGAKLTIAVTMIMLLSRGHTASSAALIAAAFLGAMVSMGFVLAVSQRVRRMSMLVVCGVMIGYICSAATDLLVTFADDSNIVNLHNWSMGSFSGMSWENVRTMALVCGAAWLAQMLPTVLAQSLDGQHMLRLHFNWVNGQQDGTLKDNYFWFYIKNIGLVYLLLIPAFLHARPKQRWLYGGGLVILVLAEFVVFQPNNYDNNKLLYVWHMLGCILAAQLLVDVFGKIRALPWRALGLAACCFLAMFGSVLTVGRELLSDYQQWSAEDIALAEFVDVNAESDALFLASDSHLTPVFALAGRRILCGSGSYVYYHGMDYSDEYSAMKALYEAPDEATLALWGVDYAVFDSTVYSKFAADENWYSTRYPLWYESANCRVYKTG